MLLELKNSEGNRFPSNKTAQSPPVFEDYFYTPVVRIARASSFIPEGEAEHRRKSTFRIGNI